MEAFLRTLAEQKPKSLKALAQALSLPVPVAAAIRRELEKRQILDRREGLGLTPQGEALCADWIRLGILLESCSACQGRGWMIPESILSSYLPVLERVCERRPSVDVTLDQALATPLTNLRRVLYILSEISLENKRIIFLGDDDWTSACLALVLKRSGVESLQYLEIEVWDIDARIVAALNSWSEDEKVSLKAVRHDLRQVETLYPIGYADAVFTDPPYTEPGLDLFCGWARRLLPRQGKLFLCYPRRDPETHFKVEEIWHHHGFTLEDYRQGWNQYEGNALHAGQSSLWLLQAVQEPPQEEVSQDVGAIYTYDFKLKQIQIYRCRQCGLEYSVGADQEWHTITELKSSGCRGCQGQVFTRKQGNPAATSPK